jgi:hypothetical protein
MDDDEEQLIVVFGRRFGMLETEQLRNLEIGAVGQFLAGLRLAIFACRAHGVRGGAGWAAEGAACLRYFIFSWRSRFLRQAEPRLRIRAE